MIHHFYRAVIQRESLKLFKQKDRLYAAMVRPILWLWVIGGGMQALAGEDYTARLLPGIVGMTLLFGGMVGGLSIAFDKDAGTMRLLVTAPVHAVHVVIAKALAASIAALVQMGMLLGLLLFLEGLYWVVFTTLSLNLANVFPWLGKMDLPDVGLLLLASPVIALSCASLGVLCGVFSRGLDNFAVMMNFVIFPLFFFSGALYPLGPMPALAKLLALANPFSYSVDLLRHSMHSHAEMPLLMNFSVLLASTVILWALSAWRFSRSGAALPLSK